jgi:hypothetical protein
MDSQEFAAEYPWISYRQAMRIAKQHSLELEACDEILRGSDILTRKNAAEVNTQSLVDWLGY